MAVCRIYLCTYRRPQLLPRALDSLLNQTFQDWICELHNDDPDDSTPKELVEKITDPRIILVNHPKNLGATQTFNLVFRKVDEPFVSLLEDDNWWNPDFLEKMLEAMEKHPEVEVAWSNMRMWQEQENGIWKNLQTSTFPLSIKEPYKLWYFPHKHQILGALHSQGAMLIRNKNIENYQVPVSTPSAIIEHVRERAYNYPILFVNQELANFAVTRSTSRSKNVVEWGVSQFLLAANFLRYMPLSEENIQLIWQEFRSKKVIATPTLLWSALLYPECRYLLHKATLYDWFVFILKIFKRPIQTYQFLKFIKNLQELQNFLERNTKTSMQKSTKFKFDET
ncbi:glycosyltransferase [Aulosira sp. FACHB-615]|uniref:glycosyltransferase family 2 protein n=1 Tax=Aulosira sp. FACHB-615 TaxID=2692777 RepID=UPI001689DE4C|nr:glycosyltransferase [Aulosira sp. FACHB-615]MBD2491109.1 glycosyltransferase [Aulosira sp. FACHB-615]